MQTNCQERVRRSGKPSRLTRSRQWILYLLKTPLKLPSKEEVVPPVGCALQNAKAKKEPGLPVRCVWEFIDAPLNC